MSNPPPPTTTDITIRFTCRDDGAPVRAEIIMDSIPAARARFIGGGSKMALTGGVGHRRWVTVARTALTAAYGAWEREQRHKAKREVAR